MFSPYCKRCGMYMPRCTCMFGGRNLCNLGLSGCNGRVGNDTNAICGSCKRQAAIPPQRNNPVFAGRIPGVGPAIDVVACKLCGEIGHASFEHKCTICGIVGDHVKANCQVFNTSSPRSFCVSCGKQRRSSTDRFCSDCGYRFM